MSITNLELLAAELEKLKRLGHTAVALDALIPYVGGLVKAARESDPEGERHRVRLTFEGQVEQYRAQVEGRREMFKSILEAGLSALKALSVLNGAATVAILAFLGNVVSKPLNAYALVTIPGMNTAMAAFAFGVWFAALGLAARYFSQASFGMDFSKKSEVAERWGVVFKWVAISAGILSLALFFIGVWAAFHAFKVAI